MLKLRFIPLLTSLLFIIINATPVFPQVHSEDVAITFISGEVLVLKRGDTEWLAARPGDILSEGDSIKTLEDAQARLHFSSGSTITLRENTLLAIDRLAAKEDTPKSRTEVSLPNGRVKAVIEKLLDKESEFEVRTPTAVAGVAGTVFYLNVVRKSEGILASGGDGDSTNYARSRPSTGLLLADFIAGGVKECYAAGGDIVTEIFVERGSVNFTNILSNLSYNVGEGNGSSADEEGGISEPKYVPPERQKEWRSGFEPPKKDEDKKKKEEKKKQADKKKEEDKKKKETPVTRKGEKSVVEKKTTGGAAAAGAGEPRADLPGTNEGANANESKDEQNDNSSKKKTESQDTDTGVNVTVTAEGHDTEVSITGKTDDRYLREELVALHNDMVQAEQRITLAQLDARLEEIQDAQDGKVVKDIHGNTVRCANYVLRPTDKKVAILFLNHRRAGSDRHEGVSSLAFEIAFDRNLPSDLKSLPWSDYMGSDEHIYYSSDPVAADTPLPEEMMLKVSNPSGDYVKMWENFDVDTAHIAYVAADNKWRQDEVAPEHYAEINGAYKELSPGSTDWWNQQYTDSTSLTIKGYLIDDNGDEIASPSESLSFQSIRGIVGPGRKHNLEFIFESDEFTDGTIDVILIPDIMDPYHDND